MRVQGGVCGLRYGDDRREGMVYFSYCHSSSQRIAIHSPPMVDIPTSQYRLASMRRWKVVIFHLRQAVAPPHCPPPTIRASTADSCMLVTLPFTSVTSTQPRAEYDTDFIGRRVLGCSTCLVRSERRLLIFVILDFVLFIFIFVCCFLSRNCLISTPSSFGVDRLSAVSAIHPARFSYRSG